MDKTYEMSPEEKLDSTMKRLQENYQEAQNGNVSITCSV
jgi:hypothetical protein